MKIEKVDRTKNYTTIMCDLDGTLAESKAEIDAEMVDIISELLETRKTFAVISGGSFHRFEKQLIQPLLPLMSYFTQLYILPASGSQLYIWNREDQRWEQQYSKDFTHQEKEKIFEALARVEQQTKIILPSTHEIYGQRVDDRDSQISFSIWGQDAPLTVKAPWDPDGSKRQVIIQELLAYIPEFEIKIGGTNTIDITQKGVDKAYGMITFINTTQIDPQEILFIGDAVFPGGNDYAALNTSIDTIDVDSVNETKQVMKTLLEH